MQGYWIKITPDWIEKNQDFYEELEKCFPDGTILNIGLSNSGNIKANIQFLSGATQVMVLKKGEVSPSFYGQFCNSAGMEPVNPVPVAHVKKFKDLPYVRELEAYVTEHIQEEFGIPEERVSIRGEGKKLCLAYQALSITHSVPVSMLDNHLDEEAFLHNGNYLFRSLKGAINNQIAAINRGNKEKAVRTFYSRLKTQVMKQVGELTGLTFQKDRKEGTYSTTICGKECFLDPGFHVPEEKSLTITAKPDELFFKYEVTFQDQTGYLETESGKIAKRILDKGLQPDADTELAAELIQLAMCFNRWNRNWLTGIDLMSVTDVKERIFPSGKLISQNKAGTIILENGKKKIEYSDDFKSCRNFQKEKLKVRCWNAAVEAMKGYGISIVKGKASEGVLNGETELKITKDGISFTYLYETPSYKDSVPQWRAVLEDHVAEIQSIYAKLAKERDDAIRRKYACYTDSFLAQDIYEFIRRNEQYITGNAVSQALRGLQIQLNTTIHYTDACGRYNILSNDDISDCLDVLIDCRLIYEKRLKGTYGDFYILKISENMPKLPPLPEQSPDKLLAAMRNKEYLTDPEAMSVLDAILAKESLDGNDYMDLFQLLQYANVVCRNINRICGAFCTAPKEILSFLRLKKDMGDDKQMQKIIRLILKAVKEHSAKMKLGLFAPDAECLEEEDDNCE